MCISSTRVSPSATYQVREYGAKAAGVREARAAAASASGGTEELEAEVQALFDEMQTQRQILDKCACRWAALSVDLLCD